MHCKCYYNELGACERNEESRWARRARRAGEIKVKEGKESASGASAAGMEAAPHRPRRVKCGVRANASKVVSGTLWPAGEVRVHCPFYKDVSGVHASGAQPTLGAIVRRSNIANCHSKSTTAGFLVPAAIGGLQHALWLR